MTVKPTISKAPNAANQSLRINNESLPIHERLLMEAEYKKKNRHSRKSTTGVFSPTSSSRKIDRRHVTSISGGSF